MRKSLITFILIVTAGCASSNNRPASVAKPEIHTEPVGLIFFGSGSTAPVTLDVTITNRADTPITIQEVEVASPGMTQYRLLTVRRFFNITIEPGQTESLTLYTTAITSMRDPGEPLSLRTIVTIEAGGARFREIVLR